MKEKLSRLDKFKDRALNWAYIGTPEQEDAMCLFVSCLSKRHHELESLQSGKRQKEDHPHHTPKELYKQEMLLIKTIALLMKEIKTGIPPETVPSILKKQSVLV